MQNFSYENLTFHFNKRQSGQMQAIIKCGGFFSIRFHCISVFRSTFSDDTSISKIQNDFNHDEKLRMQDKKIKVLSVILFIYKIV